MTLDQALQKLAKWRSVFAGWQLGTRMADDPECQAVKDHREATLIMRVEVNALTALLVSKGVFSVEELSNQIREEAIELDMRMEKCFPGITTSESGVHYDTKVAAETMKGWKP